MRTIKELYQMLLESGYIETESSICQAILKMYAYIDDFSTAQKNLLKEHFSKQRPKILSRFWWHPTFNKFGSKDLYWWKRDKKGNKQRIKFIEHIISKL